MPGLTPPPDGCGWPAGVHGDAAVEWVRKTGDPSTHEGRHLPCNFTMSTDIGRVCTHKHFSRVQYLLVFY